jgi:hypothetical protein
MHEIFKLFNAKYLFFYLRSRVLGFIARSRYKNINCFCLFIGYPRTGHSLVASLLDAHPEIVVAMEWNVLHFIEHGYNRDQILWALERNSKNYRIKCNNIWTGYNYKVEGLWQGYANKIKVIGDKNAGATSEAVIRNPLIINNLKNVINSKIKLIHIIRNPYDTITTMAIRVLKKKNPDESPNHMHLLPMIKRFFEYATAIEKIRTEKNFDIIDLYHEEIIKNPIKELKRLIEFLELEANEQYFQSCASIIYNKPNKSRNSIIWSTEIKDIVKSEIQKISFLKHYCYDDN